MIYGSTEQEHDNNLTHFMDIAKQHGLVLNSKKCEIKSKQVSFFGQLYTSNGMKPDPQKVSDLREMPEPTNKVELQQFLGFITYLSRFVKHFSTKSATLRDLLRRITRKHLLRSRTKCRRIRSCTTMCNTIRSQYVSIQRGIISIGRSCILASTRVFRCRTAVTQVTRTRVKPDR